MLKRIFGVVAVVCAFMFSPAVFADSNWYCGERLEKMVDSLKLTDDQKNKIKPILEQLKTTAKSSGEQMDSLDSQIDQQVQSTTYDQSTVDGLVDKKSTLIGTIMKAKVSAKNQIYNILTPEQRTAFQNKMTEIKNKMAEEYKKCGDDKSSQ